MSLLNTGQIFKEKSEIKNEIALDLKKNYSMNKIILK